MSLFKKKEKGPVLSPEHAEQILFEVFDSCGFEKNTVPLDVLLSYANYRKEKYTFQKTAIIFVLVLFMLLPLLFVTAEILIAVNFSKENSNPEYTVTVAPFIPVDSISVKMNGRTVPIYEVNSHEFVIKPTDSGEMSVTVTLFNQQTSTDIISVEGVDTTPPTLVSVDTEDDKVSVNVEDTESGVDYSGITAVNTEGESVVWTHDEANDLLLLDYPSSVVTIFVPDMRGNVLTVKLNP